MIDGQCGHLNGEKRRPGRVVRWWQGERTYWIPEHLVQTKTLLVRSAYPGSFSGQSAHVLLPSSLDNFRISVSIYSDRDKIRSFQGDKILAHSANKLLPCQLSLVAFRVQSINTLEFLCDIRQVWVFFFARRQSAVAAGALSAFKKEDCSDLALSRSTVFASLSDRHPIERFDPLNATHKRLINE